MTCEACQSGQPIYEAGCPSCEARAMDCLKVQKTVTTKTPHQNAFFQVPVGTELKVYWPKLSEGKQC